MSGSEFSTSYQLNIGGTNYGSPINGNGSSISFGPVDELHGGTCLVYATKSGCTSTVVAGTTLVFYPHPTGGTVTVSNTDDAVCTEHPVTLTANPNVPGFYNYQWYSGPTTIIPGATSYTYTTTVGGDFHVVVSNSCYSVTLTYPNHIITRQPLGALADISPTTQQYVQGALPTTFTATAANADPNGYNWTVSQPSAGTILSGGNTSTMTFSWNSGFFGEVTINAIANGCGYPSSKSLTINVLPTNNTGNTTSIKNVINYVKESDVRTPGTTATTGVEALTIGQKNVTYTYYNGLGVPAQKVQQNASSNNNKDMVQQIQDDQYGREAVAYQPYTATTTDGSYHPYAVSELETFYNPSSPGATNIATTLFPFAEKSFEPAPLNRVIEQGAPGDVWQLTAKPTAVSPGHTAKADFTTNDNSAFNPANTLGTKNVLMYTATVTATNNIRTLSGTTSTVYTPGALFVMITKDENWISTNGVIGTTEEYRDINGRVVLRRIYNKNGANTDMLSTYYVYDDFGNLCYVLPPLANPDNGSISQTTLDNLCFQYRYDQKNRLVQKKLPGKGWEFLVYNKLDKVAATQDANQRNNSPQQWTFTKYDAQGRVAMTGMFTSGSTADGATPPSLANLNSLQNSFNITTAPLWETRDNTTTTGYKNLSLPAGTSYTFYTINYYDDYTTPTGKIPSAFTYVSASSMTRGLPTVSFVDVLTTSNMLCTVSFYDGLGRAAKQFKQHYLGGVLNGGNYDLVTNNYNFDNSPDTIHRDHFTAAGGSTAVVSMLNTYVYDLIGRQKQIKKRINSATDIILGQNDYNEVGQLITKHLHSTNGGTTFLQNTSYAYNERGWLKKINDPASVSSTQAFGEQLYYGDNPTTSLRLYNGSISTIKWQTLIPIGSGIIQQWQNFDYIYDNINRLLSAHYTSQTVADAGAYDEALAYDWNGNIKTLNRWGKPSGIQQIDQLQYTYANSGLSNQLISVNDLSTYSAGQPSGLANYGYAPDLNGNLVTDSKKATTITHNYLSLPQNITQTGNSNTLQFVYTATGQKLRKIYGTAIRDYDDGIEYNNGVIEFVQTEEGRATPGTSYAYEYLIKDHLGNTRATVKQDGKVYQLQDYYAFGMDIPVSAATSPDNRYKYNGKEYENEMALSEYDYGARFYDPVIGRFTTIDPEAEEFETESPYIYGENNPVLMIDPDGREAEEASGDEQGKPKPKPKPKPIQLKEVVIKGYVPKKQYFGSYEYTIYVPNQATLDANRRQLEGFLERWTPLGREGMLYLNLLNMTQDLQMSKIGTPRVKSGRQLRKEWEKATGKKWPKEPGDPNRNQVAHHIKPLADGGEDGYPNIEPKPAADHTSWHQMLGDFIRWGAKRTGDVD